MARRACGPQARNSPRRPAPWPPAAAPLPPPAAAGPPPRAPRPHPRRKPPVESRNCARAGPRRGAVGGGRAASQGKASERGGAGGGVGEGLEPVLRKTGPRTKRNPRCELVDRRRLLLRRRSRCHLRTPPRVAARSVPRSGSGEPEVTSARGRTRLPRGKATSRRGTRPGGRGRRPG